MRDADSLQRRRRLLMLRSNAAAGHNGRSALPDATQSPTRIETARRQLFQACRGREGVMVVIDVAGERHEHTLTADQPFVIIGRDPRCEIPIDHPALLPRQACLQWIDGRLFCCGLGPADSTEFSSTAWIDRNPVDLGCCRIAAPDVEPAGSDADPQTRSRQLATEVPLIELGFARVEQRDNLWPVDRPVTLIGRGAQCRLRLDHPEIPPVLASLVRTPSGCWLVNLSGNADLQVNDAAVLVTSLDLGDRLQLGVFQAEVNSAPYCSKTPATSNPATSNPTTANPVDSDGPVDGIPVDLPVCRRPASVRELATRHRQRLGKLNRSLEQVQVYLDSEHLDGIPELKSALQQYIRQAQRHHRELQEALEQLSVE